jgi:hypothetical protein
MSGLVFDANYISIPMIETYSQVSLNGNPAMSAPTGVALAGVATFLQSSIPLALIYLSISPVCVKRKDFPFCFSIMILRKSPTSPSYLN